jgi:imidazolonepropionase-like amidohydrolase
MTGVVLICGDVFDGLSDALTGPAEILIEDDRISRIDQSVGRPPGAQIIDLSDRMVSPGFIETHVHLTMDAPNLAAQTLESSAAKAHKGRSTGRDDGRRIIYVLPPIASLFGLRRYVATSLTMSDVTA